MSVYFVRSNEFVKIGVSGDFVNRFKSMQTDNPMELVVELLMPGSYEVESYLHNHFMADHYRGEWFHYSESIQEFIQSHKDVFNVYKLEVQKLILKPSEPKFDGDDPSEFIRDYYMTNFKFPTYQLVVDNTRLTSKSQVKTYMDALVSELD